jgi:transposase
MRSHTKGKEYSSAIKNSLVGMRIAGMKNKDIAAHFGMPESAACSIWKRYIRRGTTDNARRSGRPKKLTKRDFRHIIRNIIRNRRVKLANIAIQTDTEVSPTTIRESLHQFGLWNRIARKKPFLSKKHIAKRLNWSKERKRWTMGVWERVIWTDEASIELGKEPREVRVWRKSHEEWETTCITPSFKSGRVSVMVWGCMVHGKLGPLVVLPKGRMDGHDYVRSVMDGPLWDFYCMATEERGLAMIMEDGAPIHRSLAAKHWREANEIEVLPWPAQSPDLNPIEHIWKALKMRISKRDPPIHNEEDLRDALQEEWLNINPAIVCRVVESMPKRIQNVILTRGGSTKY